MKAETLQLALAAEDVLRDWGLREDSCVITNGSLGFLEHCIHEMAHAQSLNLPFNKRTPGIVSDQLGDDDHGRAEEARAWAIEWFVWKTLDIPLTWDDLCCGADIQGVEESEIDELKSDPEILQLSHGVVADLRELSQTHRDDMKNSYAVTNNRWGHITSGKGPYHVFRYEAEADDFLKLLPVNELLKLAALHIQDIDGDDHLTKELMRRGTQT